MNSEDKIYTIRKVAVMLTCMLIFITLGLVVINFQAKTVTVNYYGEIKAIKTMSNTVEGMLMQNKIYIDDKAVVYPSSDTRLINNMEIKIYSEETVAKLDISEYIEKASNNITEKVVQESIDIPFEKENKNNTKEDRSFAKVIQKGEIGKKIVTYVLTFNGDKQIAKAVVNENVEKAALKEIVEVGTKISSVSRSAQTRNVTVDGSFKSYKIKLSVEQQKYAYNVSKQYGVQYELFLAMMYVESGYNANAKTSTGYGMCQINPTNLSFIEKKIGATNLMDPYDNMKAGAFFLSRYTAKWGTSAEGELNALNSYNWGEARYRTYLSKGNNAYSWYYGNKVVAIRNKLVTNGGL